MGVEVGDLGGSRGGVPEEVVGAAVGEAGGGEGFGEGGLMVAEEGEPAGMRGEGGGEGRDEAVGAFQVVQPAGEGFGLGEGARGGGEVDGGGGVVPGAMGLHRGDVDEGFGTVALDEGGGDLGHGFVGDVWSDTGRVGEGGGGRPVRRNRARGERGGGCRSSSRKDAGRWCGSRPGGRRGRWREIGSGRAGEFLVGVVVVEAESWFGRPVRTANSLRTVLAPQAGTVSLPLWRAVPRAVS